MILLLKENAFVLKSNMLKYFEQNILMSSTYFFQSVKAEMIERGKEIEWEWKEDKKL